MTLGLSAAQPKPQQRVAHVQTHALRSRGSSYASRPQGNAPTGDAGSRSPLPTCRARSGYGDAPTGMGFPSLSRRPAPTAMTFPSFICAARSTTVAGMPRVRWRCTLALDDVSAMPDASVDASLLVQPPGLSNRHKRELEKRRACAHRGAANAPCWQRSQEGGHPQRSSCGRRPSQRGCGRGAAQVS